MLSKIPNPVLADTSTLDRNRPASPALEVTIELLTAEGPSVRSLAQGQVLTIGREQPSLWIVADSHLSRQHVRLTREGSGVLVEDLDSKNGTFVGGMRVTKAVAQAGDELLLGPVVVNIRVQTSGQAAEPTRLLDYERWRARVRDELARGQRLASPFTVAMVRIEGSNPERGRAMRRLLGQLNASELAAIHSSHTLAVLLRDTAPLKGLVRLEEWTTPSKASAQLFVGAAFFPSDGDSPDALITRAFDNQRNSEEPGAIRASATLSISTDNPVVVSKSMRSVYALVERVAGSSVSVLILGETGSGKELIARALHAKGPRKDGPFIALNCGALPSNLVESSLFGFERGAFTGAERASVGAFEAAHGGTLFLDEVAELPLAAQVALLRVLETRSLSRVGSTRSIAVDVCVIAATHRNLEAMTREGCFRSDLLYRLNTVLVELPPLRARREEIAPLAERFLCDARSRWNTPATQLSEEASRCLQQYDWPGNIRELRNVIERASLTATGVTIQVDDLPAVLGAARDTPTLPAPADALGNTVASLPGQVRDFEAQLILDALARADGNQRRAAEQLQLPLRTLVYKIRALGLRSPQEVRLRPALDCIDG